MSWIGFGRPRKKSTVTGFTVDLLSIKSTVKRILKFFKRKKVRSGK